MIDTAKVVDIVLLLIDGSYGFEMETMEFLNVLSTSGMPGNVFGILTKLDHFKKQDTLRARKKQLKHRFWTELYQGAKLFYLSGVVNNRYPDREVLNISRFLSVMKNPRPLVWRNSHPYCLADRFLDLTPPTSIEENPKCDRTIALYGYLRGTNFPAQGTRVHIPGVGDLNVSNVQSQPDPCPTPHMDQAVAKATGKATRKRLGERQKVLYAPMSDVGGVLVDKDAVYIDVKAPTFNRDQANLEDKGFGEQMVMNLQGDRRLLGYADGGLRLFGENEFIRDDRISDDTRTRTERRPVDGDVPIDGNSIDAGEVDEAYVSGDDGQSGIELRGKHSGEHRDEFSDDEEVAFDDQASLSDPDVEGGGPLNDTAEDDEDNESDSEDYDGALNWKTDLAGKARVMHSHNVPRRSVDLTKVMYNLDLSPSEAVRRWNGIEINEVVENTEEFFKKKASKFDGEDEDDRMIPIYDYDDLTKKWSNAENFDSLRERFASGRVHRLGAEEDSDDGHEDDGLEAGDSDEGDGDFEDLEADESAQPNQVEKPEDDVEAEREKTARKKEELRQRFEEEDPEGLANPKVQNRLASGAHEEAQFGEDEWYDSQKAKIQKQLDVNREELDQMEEAARVRVEGYRAGTYARIVLDNMPYEFAAHFNPHFPLILGGLNPTETRFGFVQARIKRHRWHQRILKNNDPLIFSLGWRRFQTIPIYTLSDSRTRNRMLKYTPEHMHCFTTFYGPLVAPNTGFVCVQSLSSKTPGFRLAANGVTLSVDESVEIVKKLKLKGYPHKIFKNTAIIRDMFASDLEIMKFKAGSLRTVSGVRGMIKGRAGTQYPDGYVRAGFEDKILKSDIVFLSAWAFVKPREFYVPVTNLLLPSSTSTTAQADGEQERQEEPEVWQGMRPTNQVRHEQSIPIPQHRDSQYRPQERPERHFNPLRVPRKLAADLPFKSQIAQMKPQKRETYMQRRAVVLGGEEKRARDLMQKLTTLRKEKIERRVAAQEKRKEPYRRKVTENLEKKADRERREKEAYWKKEGKKRMRQEESAESGKKRKKQ